MRISKTKEVINISHDNSLWLQFWRDQRNDFHQLALNPLLSKFWPGLGLAPGSRVFVPLCGKSLDMLWLLEQGHEVIGVELSPVAVRAFFLENHLKPVKQRVGKFTLWKHGKLSILCGDYFSLTPLELGVFDAVYDLAALTALPEDIRQRYIVQLRLIVPETAIIFLLTTEDAEENQTLSQALGVDEEINNLYSENFDIELVCVESVFESAPDLLQQTAKRVEYKVYQVSGRLKK
ncbi:thiopurine S-methyltransferase [Methyloprofundus sedimenti]|uniref:Thiopurine S-methyltransferase n=1 Tax=Methyloprofundus sedimenti TaxID=1420851 RepID=A0A1V8M1S6_9GAMM|nr:thiopurine S-methyltransferase [Methyloprofundus sedimenti]OQK15510.1 thiopurine S-methyltransferase [Methyloprofundus sedimenti]